MHVASRPHRLHEGVWGSPFFRLVSENADVFSALPSNLHETLLREYISGASSPGLQPGALDRLVAPWLGEGQAAFYRQIAQADEQLTAEVEPRYPEIDIPTLIVWGAADEWIPIDRAHRLASLIPKSSLEIIDGAGHLIQEDRSVHLNQMIREWLISRRR